MQRVLGAEGGQACGVKHFAWVVAVTPSSAAGGSWGPLNPRVAVLSASPGYKCCHGIPASSTWDLGLLPHDLVGKRFTQWRYPSHGILTGTKLLCCPLDRDVRWSYRNAQVLVAARNPNYFIASAP